LYIKINNMRITQATRTNWAMVLLSSAVKIAVTSYVIWIALSLYSWYMYGINTTVEEYTVHKRVEEWREILINVTLIGGVVLPGLFLHQEIVRLLIGLKNGEILRIYQHKITVIDERVEDADDDMDINIDPNDIMSGSN
tara:strand:+ start:2073 stop:2489 length:417 start_codon:yes stop_codon:yes gene_type:complete